MSKKYLFTRSEIEEIAYRGYNFENAYIWLSAHEITTCAECLLMPMCGRADIDSPGYCHQGRRKG